ncbi:substrate-binding domain-containing protein [Nonomuraea zeae]|uniref:substrate-binding domain-containing protein n=1 Tax=Nonomuraea zeae TaxID=1642303 RepID=UPI0014794CDC|nr:GntR family transcriptional regulator [Nonomuraea zeae]
MSEPKRGEKFRLLADELRRGIAEVRWPEGRLPTEQQLSKEQGVSLNTVRRAVDLLVNEGLVYRRQGSGTYVQAEQPRSGPVVGVIVPSMTYYYPRIIAGIESEVSRNDAQLLLRSTGYDVAQETQAVESMIAAGAQGLLIVPELAARSDAHAYLERLGLPLVLVERRFRSGGDIHEFVCSNHAAGGYIAARHLFSLGHSKIAFLARSSPHAAEVAHGLREALAHRGLEPAVDHTAGRWTAADAESCLDRLLAAGCTAALCFADREATLLIAAAVKRGLSVPGDLSVIGYDDEIADLSAVPLTAISPAKQAVGRLAVQTLLRRLADPDAPLQQHLVVPTLAVRESTDIHSP